MQEQIENAEVSKQIPEQVIEREHLGDPDDIVTSYALLITLESGQLGTQETSLPQSSSQAKMKTHQDKTRLTNTSLD